MNLYGTYFSPLGKMWLQACPQGLLGAWFERPSVQLDELSEEGATAEVLVCAMQQLDEYFLGQRKFFDIPIATTAGLFQRQLMWELMRIPYATTLSYQEVARKMANPRAARAVGYASAKNPICIIVPCHRVIGKNGKLTGYAGGIERKSWLLEFENKNDQS